jgi:exopolyphosphatase/guanosine-5'-triphosphate,3'-diphosphate pyrophosphatase
VKSHYFGTMMVSVQGIDLLIIDLKKFETIERVHKSIAIGDDIYHDTPVDLEDVDQITQTIQGYLQLLNDYQIINYQLWGSEALAHAVNADFISDQIFLRTGIKIQWLSVNEETYYQNQAILVNLKKRHVKLKYPLIHFINVNSGNTTITQFNQDRFVFSTYFPLGPVRIAEDLENLRQNVPNSVEVLNDYIDSKFADFKRALPTQTISDASDAILLGTMPLSHIKISKKTLLSDKEFEVLFDKIIDASDQYINEEFGIPESEIPLLLPELLLSRRILQLTNAKRVLFSDTNVLDGLAINEADKLGLHKHQFTEQIVIMSENIANHYRVEPVHRKLVTKFALHLFDQLKSMHGLDGHERLLLQVAAILHDVGAYIDTHEHYLHSDYIIRHSDIIGLSDNDCEIIAAVTRYHSTQTPGADLSRFQKLPTEQRLLIAKLAAILRLADALDDDRQQKIKRISVSLKPNSVVVTAFSNSDLALENWIFTFKSRFFEETFGLKVRLKQRSLSVK